MVIIMAAVINMAMIWHPEMPVNLILGRRSLQQLVLVSHPWSFQYPPRVIELARSSTLPGTSGMEYESIKRSLESSKAPMTGDVDGDAAVLESNNYTARKGRL
jgi:hypothetical protein